MSEEVLNTLLGVIVGGILALISSLMLDYIRERRRNKRFRHAISSELGYNHQLLMDMNSNNLEQITKNLRTVVWDRLLNEGRYDILQADIRRAYYGFYLGLLELDRESSVIDKSNQSEIKRVISLKDKLLEHYTEYFKKK